MKIPKEFNVIERVNGVEYKYTDGIGLEQVGFIDVAEDGWVVDHWYVADEDFDDERLLVLAKDLDTYILALFVLREKLNGKV